MKRLASYLYYISCLDFTTYHYKTLLLLVTEPLTQSNVASNLGVSKQNIHKVFKFLEQGNYIIVDRVEGKNKFYRINLDIKALKEVMPGQVKF